MAEQSIFHNIVRRETAYTQLLCNLLKRDKDFRAAFFEKCWVDSTGVQDWHIRAEERLLGGYGQADIYIQAPNLHMIIEIKTEVNRGKQPSQELDAGKKTYLAWLKRHASGHAKSKLIFLIPPDWVHLKSVVRKIEQYKKSLASNTIEVGVLDWPQILPILKDNVLLKEFRFLIEERFGPIGFSEEEKHHMFNGKFPIDQAVKLVKLIDDLRKSLNGKDLDIQKEEFGFYLEKKGDKLCQLYVGCGPDVSADKSNLIYFGVGPRVSECAREAFIKSLMTNYSQKVSTDGIWMLGHIPAEDFDETNALAKIEPKLKAIWAAMQKAKKKRTAKNHKAIRD